MGELRFKFSPEKAGQATAYLLKLSGGKHGKGQLDKMLYAADWSQLRRFGAPLTGDQPVSMPQGPVLSDVLHLLTGEMNHPFWEKHISKAPKGSQTIHLLAESPTDLLSDAELETLGKVHATLAHLSWEELKAFCYKHFTEWKDPKGSQAPIDFETMLLKSGRRKSAFVGELISIQKERDVLAKAFAG
jgi:antitoxin SocA-like protein